jgi:hypothetical protein
LSQAMQRRTTRGLALSMAAGLLAALLPVTTRAGTLGADVVGMFPKNVGEFAYADLRSARQLPWFAQLERKMLPQRFRQIEVFLKAAGIDPSSTVDEIAWASVVPDATHGNELVGVALGNFTPATAEAFFKKRKLPTGEVRGYKLYALGSGRARGSIFLAFLDSNTAVFGQREALEELIKVRFGDVQGLLANDRILPLINDANGQGMIWAVLDRRFTRLAVSQLLPRAAKFSQAPALLEKVKATIISAQASGKIQIRFEAVCDTPDDADTLGVLLQAGLLYRRYQARQTDQDLARTLDSAQVVPRGDRLDLQISLTRQQMISLIQRHVLLVKM